MTDAPATQELRLDSNTHQPDFSGMSAREVWRFITAGRAIFTLRSKGTDKRYTYRVSIVKPKVGEPEPLAKRFFVGYLTGPDNQRDYAYLGMLQLDPNGVYESFKLKRDAVPGPAAAGFTHFVKNLRAIICYEAGHAVKGIEFFHEGRCGRCARPLTVPESCRSGFGPECAGK